MLVGNKYVSEQVLEEQGRNAMTGSSNSKYRSESNDIAMDVWTDALRNDQCGSVERRGVDSKQR